MPTMILSRSRFLHLPKTGGAWVSEALTRAGVAVVPVDLMGGHADLERCPGKPLFTFAFVRHPLSWWRSYWGYRMRTGWEPNEPLDATCASDDFQQFLGAALSAFPGYYARLLVRYVGGPGRAIDFVGRFERLTEDLIEGLLLGGESFDVEAVRSTAPVNATDYREHRAEYSPELRSGVLKAEKYVIERFYHGR